MWVKFISLRTKNSINQNDAGLLDQIENINTTCTPKVLYSYSLQKINEGKYDDAAWAYLVAVAYGKYDALRVEDNSAERVEEMFLHDFIFNHPETKSEEYRQSFKKLVSDKDRLIEQLKCLGKPTYKPSYMIQFTSSGLKDNITKVDDSNPNELWRKVIDQIQERL